MSSTTNLLSYKMHFCADTEEVCALKTNYNKEWSGCFFMCCLNTGGITSSLTCFNKGLFCWNVQVTCPYIFSLVTEPVILYWRGSGDRGRVHFKPEWSTCSFAVNVTRNALHCDVLCAGIKWSTAKTVNAHEQWVKVTDFWWIEKKMFVATDGLHAWGLFVFSLLLSPIKFCDS